MYDSSLYEGAVGDVLRPDDRLARVLPTFLFSNMFGALRSNQSTGRVEKDEDRDGRRRRMKWELTLAGEGIDDLFLQALLAF